MDRRWIVLCAGLGLAACGGEPQEADETAAAEQVAPAADPAAAALDRIRQGTLKYQDVAAAEAEGYMMDPSGMCVDATMVGAPAEAGSMGVHWMSPGLLGVAMPPNPEERLNGTDPAIDWSRPEVLVYEPQADGSMKLVAAEYMVFKAAWEQAGNTEPPNLEGEPFVLMADDPNTEVDEAHGFEPHYELHVWVHRDNPAGTFAEFNPAVSCQHAKAKTM